MVIFSEITVHVDVVVLKYCHVDMLYSREKDSIVKLRMSSMTQ